MGTTTAQHLGFRDAFAPEALWRAEQYDSALKSLAAGILDGGVLLLTGEPGTGKTTLTHAVAAEVRREGVVVGRLVYPVLEGVEFLSGVAEAFGLPGALTTRAEFDAAFAAFAASTRERGARLLLIIDDAGSVPASSLREVARLTRASLDATPVLTVLLAGHERLREAVATAGIEPSVAVQVRPLTAEESLQYIRHRLRLTTGAETALTVGSMERICREGGGIPQVINVLCQHAAADTRRDDSPRRAADETHDAAAIRPGAQAPTARLTRSRGAVIAIVAITVAAGGAAALTLTRLTHRVERSHVSVGSPGSPAAPKAPAAPRPVTSALGTSHVGKDVSPRVDAPRVTKTAPAAEVSRPGKRARGARPRSAARGLGAAEVQAVARRQRAEVDRPTARAKREPAPAERSERRPVDDGVANDPSAIIDWMLKDHHPTTGSPLD